MNISKLSKFARVFFALALTTTTVFGQGYRNRNNAFNNQNQVCLNQINDLTDEQKTKIEELENNHQKEMTALREKRQSTRDAIEKNEIRGTMLKTVKAHREKVRNLLTEEQQKQLDQLPTNGNNYRNRNGNGNSQGRQQFRGQQMFAGNYGNGCRGNWDGRQGNGRGNRQFKGCNRNFNQNN
jgi:Spy/CpxP family protein refolding chaperone